METRIKELREKHGLTQEGLADKVGVTRQTILFLLAYKIARVFGVMIEDVFSFEDETTKP